MSTPLAQSFRADLSRLEQMGALHRIRKATDPRYEISGLLWLRRTGPAQLFEHVRGCAMPVAGNVLNSRQRIATLLGVTEASLPDHLKDILSRSLPPVVVEDGPVQEMVHDDRPDLATLLPVPTWFEHETGPYITAGVIIARDPETGRRNVSIARIRLDGGARIMVGIARNHHLNILAEKAAAMNTTLPIAVSIGNCASVLIGSQLYLGLGDDEFDSVGALLGEPLRLVRCRTVPLEVPAEAEIVLEGHIDARDQVEEKTVSEFHGFYAHYGFGTGGEIRCVTTRRSPIYQAILPGFAPEHCLIGAVAIEAVCLRLLQGLIPCVRRVVVTEGGMGRLHAIIVMHRPRPGEAKRAIILAMGQVNLLKHVIAVDDDIDPENPMEVEWSIAARFRGDQDLLVLPGMKADRADPVHENLTITKVGIVACRRPGDGERGGNSERVRIPADVLATLQEKLEHY